MKKMTYDTPSVEIISFATEDVICTSVYEGIELPIIPVD